MRAGSARDDGGAAAAAADDARARQVSGYKILVQNVPSDFDRARIDGWLAERRCPMPTHILISDLRAGRRQLVLTFQWPYEAVSAKQVLSDRELEEGRPRTRTSWWKNGG